MSKGLYEFLKKYLVFSFLYSDFRESIYRDHRPPNITVDDIIYNGNLQVRNCVISTKESVNLGSTNPILSTTVRKSSFPTVVENVKVNLRRFQWETEV